MDNLWIDTNDVILYTDNENIKNRDTNKLENEILMAQSYIKWFTKNNFKDFIEIPKEVKLAAIKITEYLAAKKINEVNHEGYNSETFDDYSYTKSSSFKDELEQLGIGFLLAPYMNNLTSTITMRLRKL